MGTGTKQRRFVEEAIDVLHRLDCSIESEKNKHYKITIVFGGNTDVWTVSSTPKTTSSQSAAIAKLRRILRQLGVPDVPHAIDFSVHLRTQYDPLWEIINDCLYGDSGTSVMNIPKLITQIKSIHPLLSDEDLRALKKLLGCLSSHESIYSAYDDITKPGSVCTSDWAVIVAGAKIKSHSKSIPCQRNVIAFATQKGSIRQGLNLNYNLEELITYYKHCANVVKLGVLVTDVWRPDDIKTYETKFEAHRKNGINSVPIVWSGSGRFPIFWPWQ